MLPVEGQFANDGLPEAGSGRIFHYYTAGPCCILHGENSEIYIGISKSSQLAGKPSESTKAHELMSQLQEKVRGKRLPDGYYWQKMR